MAASAGVSRWTRAFAVESALWMVLLQVGFLLDVSLRSLAVLGVFGAVLTMVFGMAYLLLPAYVGRTLGDQRLAGFHFLLATVAVVLLSGSSLEVFEPPAERLGVFLWCGGVAVFVGALAQTVLLAVTEDPTVVIRSEDRPQRSTRFGTAALPVAIGYLIVAAASHLALISGIRLPLIMSVPAVIHAYATGFVTLLIFALGIRLLTGFFHVAPPRSLSWLVLGCGAVGPAVLIGAFWRPPWFLLGAALEATAMAGYVALVGIVLVRTDRRHVGRYGIVIGALAGLAGVAAGIAGVVRLDSAALAVHVPLVLDGFLLLTIIGYAYQFFPVTTGRYPGADERTALATILLLAAGTVGIAIGSGLGTNWFRLVGSGLTLIGTAGYTYLLVRRFA